jgi:gluconolactonase
MKAGDDKIKMKLVLLTASLVLTTLGQAQKVYRTVGNIERLDSAINKIVSADAVAEVIADGFAWSEGPLWVEKHKMLLVSDVRQNTVYKWTQAGGKEVYLTPSGYTGSIPRKGEMGSNGLMLDKKGRLVLCQDGDRQMARMDAPLDKPAPKFISLASNYNGKKLSSPNDGAFNSEGELFFTDPPYGLVTQSDRDSAKEIPFNGVYKVNKKGELILLIDSLARPNGIAFLPGEKQLIISNSDPRKPNWYIYDVKGDGLANGRIFYSEAGCDRKLRGLPDGLKIDKKGNVYAAGPGGIHFFNSSGKLLGILKVPEATSNVSLSADEKTLYITNNMNILRLKMRK